MVQFPPTVSHTAAENIKRIFTYRTQMEWHDVGLMNVKIKEDPYTVQGRTYLSHNIVFELFDEDLKHIISIKEKDYRKWRQKRQKLKQQ